MSEIIVGDRIREKITKEAFTVLAVTDTGEPVIRQNKKLYTVPLTDYKECFINVSLEWRNQMKQESE